MQEEYGHGVYVLASLCFHMHEVNVQSVNIFCIVKNKKMI